MRPNICDLILNTLIKWAFHFQSLNNPSKLNHFVGYLYSQQWAPSELQRIVKSCWCRVARRWFEVTPSVLSSVEEPYPANNRRNMLISLKKLSDSKYLKVVRGKFRLLVLLALLLSVDRQRISVFTNLSSDLILLFAPIFPAFYLHHLQNQVNLF